MQTNTCLRYTDSTNKTVCRANTVYTGVIVNLSEVLAEDVWKELQRWISPIGGIFRCTEGHEFPQGLPKKFKVDKDGRAATND